MSSGREDTFHLGVKALIRNAQGEILLLKINTANLTRTKEPYWDIPGGRLERGEDMEETLRREIEEETGITAIGDFEKVDVVLSNIRIPVGDSDVGLLLAIYTVDAKDNGPVQLSPEHTEAKWFTPAEAATALTVKYPPSFTEKVQYL